VPREADKKFLRAFFKKRRFVLTRRRSSIKRSAKYGEAFPI
jgi:hypothetical protein